MSGDCTPHHDWFNALLTFGLCCGLVISYLPQHYRIIHARSSEGFSPIFLLLGTTSAAASMLNMITLQAPIVNCCRVLSYASCLESSAGVIQVGLQWLCFTIIFVLYMLYYPVHLKHVEFDSEEHEALLPRPSLKGRPKSPEWRRSVVVAWIAAIHFFCITIITIYLLATVPRSPDDAIPQRISSWATFLGITSAILAAIQYAPQLLHTYSMKLVGALSIPMMMIQTPGGLLMVTSIALRPGTNWTSWITFLVAAILQGCLLAMCIVWKVRQRKLGIDDFGNAISSPFPPASWPVQHNETVPGSVNGPSDNPAAVQVALTGALEAAAEADIPSGLLASTVHGTVGERTPLLVQQRTQDEDSRKIAKT